MFYIQIETKKFQVINQTLLSVDFPNVRQMNLFVSIFWNVKNSHYRGWGGSSVGRVPAL